MIEAWLSLETEDTPQRQEEVSRQQQAGARERPDSGASRGSDVSRTPSRLQDSRVNHGESGPPPQEPSTRRCSSGEQQGNLARESSLKLQLETYLAEGNSCLPPAPLGSSPFTVLDPGSPEGGGAKAG